MGSKETRPAGLETPGRLSCGSGSTDSWLYADALVAPGPHASRSRSTCSWLQVNALVASRGRTDRSVHRLVAPGGWTCSPGSEDLSLLVDGLVAPGRKTCRSWWMDL